MRIHVHELTNEIALCAVQTLQGKLDYVHIPTMHIQNCLKSLLPYEGNTIQTNDRYSVHCVSSAANEFEINLMRPNTQETQLNDADHVLSVRITPSGYQILHAHDKHTLHTSLTQCLQKLTAELLPLYSTCVTISSLIQNSSSESLLNLIHAQDSMKAPIKTANFRMSLSNQFLQDNANIISQLTDRLNQSIDKPLCYKYAAKLIHLGALFCIGAQSGEGTCFHVNEFRSFRPSTKMMQLIRNRVPLKRGVTVLTKGNSQAIRMYRHNLNVRFFSQESPLTQCISEESMPLNSHIKSDVMVITGIFNNQLAVICLGQENFTARQINVFLNNFYC